MDFLFSNYNPLKTSSQTFADSFYSLLPQTDKLDIAVGYITSDSLIELQKAVELNHVQKLNLIIGMHYIEQFTQVEYKSAVKLNEFLHDNGAGEVRLVTPFRYHGKLYSFQKGNKAFAGIIGSNNLSSIVDCQNRIYESSILINDELLLAKMQGFISDLRNKATENIANLNINTFKTGNPILEGQDFVSKVSPQELAQCLASLTDVKFDIPIKDTPQSNLNVFFGKGRETKSTGVIKPRHWYEAEIIVSKAITSLNGYPKAQTDSASFDVITDDGWKFRCKVSGDYSKNFRSEGDLRILGKWLKGRLENAGVLSGITPVTAQELQEYGRCNFSMTKTTIPNLWYLDFKV